MNFLKKNSQKYLGKIFLFVSVFILPILARAETTIPPAVVDPTITEKIVNPIPNIETVNGFIKTLLEGLLKIGIPLIAIAILYCGFLFVAAQGKKDKLTEAKSAFLYTLIGAAILLGSWAIAQLITNTVLAL